MSKLIGDYEILGKVGTEPMFLAKNSMGENRILKQYSLASSYILNARQLMTLEKIKHENITVPLDSFGNGKYNFAVYNELKGINLEEYVKENGSLSEKEIITVVKKLIAGYRAIKKNEPLLYTHVTPRNIYVEKERNLAVKLFGFLFNENVKSRERKFIEPEIISGKKSQNITSDIWSLGVIIKFMLGNKKPSEYCNDFISQCLKADVQKRIRFDEILFHPFLKLTEVKRKYCSDIPYICTCNGIDVVTLSCGDSFCLGCTVAQRRKSEFNGEDFIRAIDIFECDINGKHYLDAIKMKCPNCLSFAEIKLFRFRCGCVYKKGAKITNIIISVKKSCRPDCLENVLVCRAHNVRITILEELMTYNSIEVHLNEDCGYDSGAFANILKDKDHINSLNLGSRIYKDEGAIAKILESNKSLRFFEMLSRLDIEAIKSIANALENNISLRSIGLTAYFDYNAFKLIMNALEANHSINSLKIAFQSFDSGNVNLMAEIIRINNTLNHIGFICKTIREIHAKEIAKALKINYSLCYLSLCKCYIVGEGAKKIVKALKVNNSMKSLDLKNTNIGYEVSEAISEVLKVNYSLNSINLSFALFGDRGIEIIAESLENNKSLISIDLSHTNLFLTSVEAIASMLLKNTSLKRISLAYNWIQNPGMIEIAKALSKNHTLESLNLSGNLIALSGAKMMAESLKENDCLDSLDLSHLSINNEGINAIVEALMVNRSLTFLNLSGSPNEVNAELMERALRMNHSLVALYLNENHNEIQDRND